MSKKKPDLAVVPSDDQAQPAAPDPNRADPTALTVTGLVRSIGALTSQVAHDQRIPVGAATAIVKTALDFHLSSQALAFQQRNSFPFQQPVEPATEEESNDESSS